MVQTIPMFFGLPGGPELLIVLMIVVLLFGAQKLPELARSSGQAMGEFQKGRETVEAEIRTARDRSLAEPEPTVDAAAPDREIEDPDTS
jgi:sec-independent protein translocase protein TatA